MTGLRVALVAGTLGRGGAEKQLVYIARALRASGVDARVYSLTRGEAYEGHLQRWGVPTRFIGQPGNPGLRVLSLVRALASFRPHVVQAGHFYANLYAGFGARAFGALSIGAIRNDGLFELQANGRWGWWLLRCTSAVVANSEEGRANAIKLGCAPHRLFLLPNVIDLSDGVWTAPRSIGGAGQPGGTVVGLVARLAPAKRVDRFLVALAKARGRFPGLRGVIFGEGPERGRLESLAAELGLLPHGVEFRGLEADIPGALHTVDMLALTSDQEGFPNVILEAMAARLPVVTTPAGDAGRVVVHGSTGYVVGFDERERFAQHLVELAATPELRRTLGQNGFDRAQREYSFGGLAGRVLAIYRQGLAQQGRTKLLSLLPSGVSAD